MGALFALLHYRIVYNLYYNLYSRFQTINIYYKFKEYTSTEHKQPTHRNKNRTSRVRVRVVIDIGMDLFQKSTGGRSRRQFLCRTMVTFVVVVLRHTHSPNVPNMHKIVSAGPGCYCNTVKKKKTFKTFLP